MGNEVSSSTGSQVDKSGSVVVQHFIRKRVRLTTTLQLTRDRQRGFPTAVGEERDLGPPSIGYHLASAARNSSVIDCGRESSTTGAKPEQ